MSKELRVQSHKGEYSASFIQGGMDELNANPIADAMYIVDEKVAKLYKDRLSNILSSDRLLLIHASEDNKSLEKCPEYVEKLVQAKLRREQPLVAIGGGIIQDITCFLATTMMRGVPWIFYPTTLLAQADSCIGSKSSINCSNIKNILGTFTPPNHIVVDVDFLDTLDHQELLSGVGEMLKVHAIQSPESFDEISRDYDLIFQDKSIMEKYIHSSLLIKKNIIEQDEFDTGIRNVMNYGHTFGHAIETATNYQIPHGVAVTIGMDMANYFASEIGVSSKEHFERMHGVMEKNCSRYRNVKIDAAQVWAALQNDKKHTATQLRLILPNMKGEIEIGLHDNRPELEGIVAQYQQLFGRS